ncbi:MAG TPA: hypothetical protein VGN96_15790 [Roseococcus sp.]|jgi:hypothetical protein|nr:hypothetical protein [Roseococcus sp.]
MEAWRAISSGRHWVAGGMGPPMGLPLSWASVEHYAEARHMDHEARVILHHVIAGLDRDWLEEQQRKAAAQ